MKYQLHNTQGKANIRFFWPFLATEKRAMLLALVGIVVNAGLNILAPLVIGRAIDTHIMRGNVAGLWQTAGILLAMYIGAFVAGYVQTMAMGGVGQRLLFTLRNAIFEKLHALPVAFFNENKAGDLISRMNNDTDKLNQFFSQSIMQFVGNAFMMLGASIALFSLHVPLGAAALAPAVALLGITRVLSPWMKQKNSEHFQATGALSGAVQESLENFKVIIAFHRRDYFRSRIAEVNHAAYRAALWAGVANTGLTPLYGLMGNVAQMVALTYGIALIGVGQVTIGVLVSVLAYVTRFYDPVRHIASFWASWQSALAAADRIHSMLQLSSDMDVLPAQEAVRVPAPVLAFEHVTFAYPEGKTVLHQVDLSFEQGKTYALVGPTGGGKTTIASLIARLYDPIEGTVFFHGQDLRTFSSEIRTEKIGFILQEPFLIQGTLHENIVYANKKYVGLSPEKLSAHLETIGLHALLNRFPDGLSTRIGSQGGLLSAGQKQIVAFMRAILREPELLILDEATANIDTVTEHLLQEALHALPKETTRVIIAHRLNTIENADEIFFVNGGSITMAGSLTEAIDMLMHKERQS